MSEVAFTEAELHDRGIRTRKNLTWLIIMAIVMFFAGLTSAYVVSKSSGYWVEFRIPRPFLISTVAILISSAFVQAALWAAARGKAAMVAPLLGITLGLGLVFTWSQFHGWSDLVEKGNFMVGRITQNKGVYGEDYAIRSKGVLLVKEGDSFYMPDDILRAKPLNADLDESGNAASAYFYALTAAHLAHLAFGIIGLLVMIAMALMGRYTPRDHVGLWAGAMYWHFLGGLWVYLLLFLTFVH